MLLRLFPRLQMLVQGYQKRLSVYVNMIIGPLPQAEENTGITAMKLPGWVRPVMAALAFVIYGVLIWYAFRHWDPNALQQIQFHWEGIAFATGIQIPGRIFGIYLRKLTLRHLGNDLPLVDHIQITGLSDLAGKLPGVFWWQISQVFLYYQVGVPRVVMLILLAIELLMVGVASSLTSIVLMLTHPLMQQYIPMPILIVALIACTILTHPSALRFILQRIPNPAIQEALQLLSWPVMIRLILGQALIVLIGGACLYGVVSAITGFNPELFTTILTISALNMVWSVALVWLPFDFGLRQGALIALLAAIFTTPIVLIILVAWRFWFTSIELGWGIAGVLMKLYRTIRSRTITDVDTQ